MADRAPAEPAHSTASQQQPEPPALLADSASAPPPSAVDGAEQVVLDAVADSGDQGGEDLFAELFGSKETLLEYIASSSLVVDEESEEKIFDKIAQKRKLLKEKLETEKLLKDLDLDESLRNGVLQDLFAPVVVAEAEQGTIGSGAGGGSASSSFSSWDKNRAAWSGGGGKMNLRGSKNGKGKGGKQPGAAESSVKGLLLGKLVGLLKGKSPAAGPAETPQQAAAAAQGKARQLLSTGALLVRWGKDKGKGDLVKKGVLLVKGATKMKGAAQQNKGRGGAAPPTSGDLNAGQQNRKGPIVMPVPPPVLGAAASSASGDLVGTKKMPLPAMPGLQLHQSTAALAPAGLFPSAPPGQMPPLPDLNAVQPFFTSTSSVGASAGAGAASVSSSPTGDTVFAGLAAVPPPAQPGPGAPVVLVPHPAGGGGAGPGPGPGNSTALPFPFPPPPPVAGVMPPPPPQEGGAGQKMPPPPAIAGARYIPSALASSSRRSAGSGTGMNQGVMPPPPGATSTATAMPLPVPAGGILDEFMKNKAPGGHGHQQHQALSVEDDGRLQVRVAEDAREGVEEDEYDFARVPLDSNEEEEDLVADRGGGGSKRDRKAMGIDDGEIDLHSSDEDSSDEDENFGQAAHYLAQEPFRGSYINGPPPAKKRAKPNWWERKEEIQKDKFLFENASKELNSKAPAPAVAKSKAAGGGAAASASSLGTLGDRNSATAKTKGDLAASVALEEEEEDDPSLPKSTGISFATLLQKRNELQHFEEREKERLARNFKQYRGW